MSIRFLCPECGKKLETAERFAGRLISCPRCGQEMSIPEAPAAEAPPPAPDVVAGALAAPAVPPRPRMLEAAPEQPLVPPPMKIDFEDLIDMTAMVDIVFFLLIFFLVTSMHALDSTIPLPVPSPQNASTGSGSASLDGDDSSVVVHIDRSDTVRIDGVEVCGPRDLIFKLRDLRSGPGRPDKLLVVGSSDASHGMAVMVLDAGHEVGMESVRLAVRDDAE